MVCVCVCICLCMYVYAYICVCVCVCMYVCMWVIVPRRIRWTERVLSFRRKENTYRVLGGKPEGKRLFGRPRGRWQDHIKMDVMEIR